MALINLIIFIISSLFYDGFKNLLTHLNLITLKLCDEFKSFRFDMDPCELLFLTLTRLTL